MVQVTHETNHPDSRADEEGESRCAYLTITAQPTTNHERVDAIEGHGEGPDEEVHGGHDGVEERPHQRAVGIVDEKHCHQGHVRPREWGGSL